jgi:hypothetical protein
MEQVNVPRLKVGMNYLMSSAFDMANEDIFKSLINSC